MVPMTACDTEPARTRHSPSSLEAALSKTRCIGSGTEAACASDAEGGVGALSSTFGRNRFVGVPLARACGQAATLQTEAVSKTHCYHKQ